MVGEGILRSDSAQLLVLFCKGQRWKTGSFRLRTSSHVFAIELAKMSLLTARC